MWRPGREYEKLKTLDNRETPCRLQHEKRARPTDDELTDAETVVVIVAVVLVQCSG
jgi:hypothetical protein